jgi:hypothetical protein
MAENALTPADIGVLMGNRGSDGMFGAGSGGGLLFAILLIVLFMGGGAWGGNRGAFGTEAIQNQMQQGFDNQNTMANQRETLAAVNAGTSQAVAATNQTFHDMLSVFSDKYTELDRDILSVGSTLQQVMANQNQCCCSTLRAIDGINYANAQNTAAINANTTAAMQKVLDAITENKIEALQGKINQLELNNAVAGVVRYPTTFSYNAGQSPFCGGCGCGSF